MITVDQAHRFSSGISKAAFWMQSRAADGNARGAGDGGDDNYDENDGNHVKDHSKNKSERASPDGDGDPWHDVHIPLMRQLRCRRKNA